MRGVLLLLFTQFFDIEKTFGLVCLHPTDIYHVFVIHKTERIIFSVSPSSFLTTSVLLCPRDTVYVCPIICAPFVCSRRTVGFGIVGHETIMHNPFNFHQERILSWSPMLEIVGKIRQTKFRCVQMINKASRTDIRTSDFLWVSKYYEVF